MPKFFICYVYEDKAYRVQLANWASTGQLGQWDADYETEDLRPQGMKPIRRHLSPKIASSQAFIVLVGQNSHNHEFVDYEVNHARSSKIPILLVRIPNTTGGQPLQLGMNEIQFSPNAIKAALASIIRR